MEEVEVQQPERVAQEVPEQMGLAAEEEEGVKLVQMEEVAGQGW